MRPPPRDFTDDERAQAVAARPPPAAHLESWCSTGSPATRRRCAPWRRVRGDRPLTSRCRGCPVTAPPSPSCATTVWGDWAGAADDAYRPAHGARRARRDHRVVRMGGSLALSTAVGHPRARASCSVNPATCDFSRRGGREMLLETLEAGYRGGAVPRQRHRLCPATGAQTTRGTPLRQLLSLARATAWYRLSSRYGELTMPLCSTSHQDHGSTPARQRAPRRRVAAARSTHRWLYAQLSRRHPGLRPRRHHHRRPRVRHRRGPVT